GLPGTRWRWRFRRRVESRPRAFRTSREGWHQKMIRKATLKIGVPVLLACMALNAYLAVRHLRQMQKMDALTVESSKTQATISGVLADLTDMETSQRGYLLTGDQSYLQPFTTANARIGTDFAALRTQLEGRPRSERSLESQLESLAKLKQAEMERTIDLRQRGYRHRSFMLVNTNEGKYYMDEIRSAAASLFASESRDFTRIQNGKTVAMKKVLGVTIIANSVLLMLAACLFGLFRYHGRLLEQEAAESKQALAHR